MPQPKIPAELFRFLGRTFNAWHISATLLESHILLFPDESRCISAATDLYRSLEEWDWLAGLWKQRCQSLATRAALSLTQLGLWEDAQAVLWNAVDKYNKGEMKGSHIGKGELSLWVEQWLECCRNLNQWDSVMEYGKTVDHQGALLDILWKINSWKELQETVMPRLSVSDTPGALIIEGQMHLLHTGDFTRADNRMTHALHTALFKWWSLPELGLDSHTPLLRDFQRLVEVIESKEALTHLRDMQQREVPPSIVQVRL